MYKAIQAQIKTVKFWGIFNKQIMIVTINLEMLRYAGIIEDNQYNFASAIGHAFDLNGEQINELTYTQKTEFVFEVKSNIRYARAFNTIQHMLAMFK